jgi:hypothetical protein
MTAPPAGIGPGNRIAEFGPFVLYGARLRNGDTEQGLSGLHASVEATGAVTRRTTATRVIAGGRSSDLQVPSSAQSRGSAKISASCRCTSTAPSTIGSSL